MYANFNKFKFYKDNIQYIGHVIFEEAILVDLDKIKAIIDWPVPKDVTDLRSFMGIRGYYRKFIEGFLKIANPITSLQKMVRNLFGIRNVKTALIN